jgi:uncharacterized membrane protein YoaK (UPF0700 family)
VVLTAVAACVDATSYLRFHVFPANMTGNTVLLAIGVAGGNGLNPLRSATALGGFVAGAVAGGIALAACVSRARFLAMAWGFELCLLGSAAGLWASGWTAGAQAFAVVALLSGTMGLQSATVAQLGLGVSTTYLTGTWTAVSSFVGRRLTGHRRQDAEHHRFRRQVAVLVCYFAAAVAAGAVMRWAS